MRVLAYDSVLPIRPLTSSKSVLEVQASSESVPSADAEKGSAVLPTAVRHPSSDLMDFRAPLNVPIFPGGIPYSPSTVMHSIPAASVSPTALSASVNRSILSLFTEFVCGDGRGVDYEGMAVSPLFASYVNSTALLQVSFSSSLMRPMAPSFTTVCFPLRVPVCTNE